MHAKNTKSVKVQPLIFENYLTMIKASEKSGLFKNFYCLVNGEKTEVTDNGRLSCAFFVTSILKIFSLVKDVQITVHRALDDMENSGWEKISEPRIGAVILWGEINAEKDKESRINAPVHRHLGFYIGEGQAISNNSKENVPTVHAWNFRTVEQIFWNKNLG